MIMGSHRHRWTKWYDPKGAEAAYSEDLSPYVAWSRTIRRDENNNGQTMETNANGSPIVGRAYTGGDANVSHGDLPEGLPLYSIPTAEQKANLIETAQSSAELENAWPTVDPNTVIVGVIDRGIPLGHHRFRDENGLSRILVAWQQVADLGRVAKRHDFLSALGVESVNYGVEFLKCEIDNLIDKHSYPQAGCGEDCGLINCWLDEVAFNVATGGEDYWNPDGDRGLGKHRSHGAHVLDAAAGCDPQQDSEEAVAFRNAVRMITVNLPSRKIVGPSGRHLESHIINAMNRIVYLADRIWDENCAEKFDEEEEKQRAKARRNKKKITDKAKLLRGFPIVINISFAKQAGRRDGQDDISKAILAINKARKGKRLPVRFVFPAGNENLSQGNAETRLESGAEVSFEWRVKNDDQTPNFVDIWTTSPNGTECKDGCLLPLAVQIVSPDGAESTLEAGLGGQQIDLITNGSHRPIARVFCRREHIRGTGDKARFQTRYVIATRYTNYYGESTPPVAPAGVWQIRLRNNHFRPLSVAVNNQTDQSELPDAGTGLPGSFEHPSYERYDVRGVLMDSYSYDRESDERPVNLDRSNVLRRHGTLNAFATSMSQAKSQKEYLGLISVIGGFRMSDGKPALYSATGSGPEEISGSSTRRRKAPTAAFPSDDSPAHFGTLAAGARNGSVVALRGTSFAAARATRFIVEQLVDKFYPDAPHSNKTIDFIRVRFEEETIVQGLGIGRADMEKVGVGRISDGFNALTEIERIP